MYSLCSQWYGSVLVHRNRIGVQLHVSKGAIQSVVPLATTYLSFDCSLVIQGNTVM